MKDRIFLVNVQEALEGCELPPTLNSIMHFDEGREGESAVKGRGGKHLLGQRKTERRDEMVKK